MKGAPKLLGNGEIEQNRSICIFFCFMKKSLGINFVQCKVSRSNWGLWRPKLNVKESDLDLWAIYTYQCMAGSECLLLFTVRSYQSITWRFMRLGYDLRDKRGGYLWRHCVGLFIYQLFWTLACPEGMCANGTQVPCEVPSLPNPITRQGWPHYRGLRPPLFSNSDVGSFTSHNNKSVKVLWDGTYGFSSLSETTRKSNHLQMSLQRQYFLLSYLKTLSVGPAGVWTCDLPLGRPALFQLS